MKKSVLILLAVLLVLVLTTASRPAPIQRVQGTLRWLPANSCKIPDYIPLPVMENVYLIGKGFPTKGQFQGYGIDAWGHYSSFGTCKVFVVDNFILKLPPTVSSVSNRTP